MKSPLYDAEHRFFHSTTRTLYTWRSSSILNGCSSWLSSSICICTSTNDHWRLDRGIHVRSYSCWRFRCSSIIRFGRWPQSHTHTHIRKRTTSASAKFNIYAPSIKFSRLFDSYISFFTQITHH